MTDTTDILRNMQRSMLREFRESMRWHDEQARKWREALDRIERGRKLRESMTDREWYEHLQDLRHDAD